MKKLLLLVPCLLILAGCPSGVESKARDTSAALKGAIGTAQAEYAVSCTASPTTTTCTTITRAIAAQNALITATEAYCSWSTSAPPPDTTTKCVPVASAQAALNAAIANATQAITEVKGVIHP